MVVYKYSLKIFSSGHCLNRPFSRTLNKTSYIERWPETNNIYCIISTLLVFGMLKYFPGNYIIFIQSSMKILEMFHNCYKTEFLHYFIGLPKLLFPFGCYFISSFWGRRLFQLIVSVFFPICYVFSKFCYLWNLSSLTLGAVPYILF
jgi:hypothetical protein